MNVLVQWLLSLVTNTYTNYKHVHFPEGKHLMIDKLMKICKDLSSDWIHGEKSTPEPKLPKKKKKKLL